MSHDSSRTAAQYADAAEPWMADGTEWRGKALCYLGLFHVNRCRNETASRRSRNNR